MIITLTLATDEWDRHINGFLKRLDTNVDAAVRQSLEDAGAQMDETVPVDTGNLSRNRMTPYSPEPRVWATGYSLPYAAILEYGGYMRVGPRTAQVGGGNLGAGFTAGAGIYSRQAPLGWVRKALASVEKTFHARVLAAAQAAWAGDTVGAMPGVGTGGSNLTDLFDVDLGD